MRETQHKSLGFPVHIQHLDRFIYELFNAGCKLGLIIGTLRQQSHGLLHFHLVGSLLDKKGRNARLIGSIKR